MTRIITFFLVLLAPFISRAADEGRPNILFIAVDDLRPELACYGAEQIHSPHIDQLAKTGVLFERAYCMVPTCGASRASLMTGIRPASNRFVNYLAWAEREAPGLATMNTHFQSNGYYTVSLGKVFHHAADSAGGWSEPVWRPLRTTYRRRENRELHRQRQATEIPKRGPAWESASVADNAYGDGLLADRAIGDLQRLSKTEQPFFLTVGFFKPHLPFVAPQKYWDLYDHQSIQLPENYHVPRGAPAESIHSSGELRAYSGIPAAGPVSDETARMLIHGYYACVSYIDAQIGRLLQQLERLNLDENTIVILWGDHGWNLGEHTLWCKHSCFETSMHIPLVVRAPGVAPNQRRAELIESIDIYPSLCQLSGIPAPQHLAGRSFVPLMKDPQAPWKTAAIGRFRRGDTIRTDAFRYTEYTRANGSMTARMLYDHQADPAENVNIALEQEQLLTKLAKQLHTEMGKNED